MYYYIEEMAMQREREVAARTRSPLFTQLASARAASPGLVRTRGGSSWRVRLPWSAWRRWAARPDRVPRGRAAGLSGAG